jgi:hypothetical protein
MLALVDQVVVLTKLQRPALAQRTKGMLADKEAEMVVAAEAVLVQ